MAAVHLQLVMIIGVTVQHKKTAWPSQSARNHPLSWSKSSYASVLRSIRRYTPRRLLGPLKCGFRKTHTFRQISRYRPIMETVRDRPMVTRSLWNVPRKS